MRQKDECGQKTFKRKIHGGSIWTKVGWGGSRRRVGGCGDILRNTGHVRRVARCGGKIMQWRSWPGGWFCGTLSPNTIITTTTAITTTTISPPDIVRRPFAAFVSFLFFLSFPCFSRRVDMFTLFVPPRLFFFSYKNFLVVWGTGQAFVLLFLCFQLFLYG
jgi:hypothetical protein